MKKLSIKHKVTTIYKPNTNGLVEHTNKVLCNILSKEVEVQKNLHNWQKQVHCALWVYNSTFKLSIGFTSFRLAYGVELTLPIEYEVMTFHTTKRHQLGIEMKDCWNWWNWKKANCENKLWNQPKLIKNNFDQRMTPQKFQESDLVMVYDNHHDRKTFKKFLQKWFVPYMVMKVFF